MKSVRVSAQARDETTDIARYISQDNPDAALRWLDVIEEAYLRISEFPESGRLRRDIGGPQSELRSRVVMQNYLILYAVRADHVEILHVVSGYRDIQELLES